MPLTQKQLIGYQPSPKEQEELVDQTNEASKKVLSHFVQQFEDAQKAALLGILQQIQEANKMSFSHLFGQKGYFNEYFKGCFARLKQQTFGAGERYSKPAYIPPPPYLRQSQPQIIYVYVYDLPGLN
jgi:hypothetical protein